MEEFGSHIYVQTNAMARKVSTLADRHFRPYGWSMSYVLLLLAIHKRDGAGQKELSRVFHLAPSTLTRFVDKLNNGGLVERIREGKEIMLELTEGGRELVGELEKEMERFDRELEKLWGVKYQDTLSRMLEFGIRQMDE